MSLSEKSYWKYMQRILPQLTSLDVDDDDDANNDVPMTLILRRLFLFSAKLGAIVWMYESNESARPMQPRHEDMTLTSATSKEGYRIGCTVASTSSTSGSVLVASINPTGGFSNPNLLQGYEMRRKEILEETWSFCPPLQLSCLVVHS